MAIAVDASSKWTGDPTNAQPHDFIGPTISPPGSAIAVVIACCSAASGHAASDINISDSGGHTWTLQQKLRQANGGANSPIGIWTASVNASSFTVEQVDTDAGFSMVQGVWVVTGAGAVIDSDVFHGTTAASISMTATAAGQLAIFGMCDWQNSQDTAAKADASMTDRKVVPGSADAQTTYMGDLFSTGAGTITIGTNVLAHPAGTNAVAILLDIASNAVTGTASVSPGGITITALGVPTVKGIAAVSPGGVTLTAVGTPQVDAQASIALPGATVTAVGKRTVYGHATLNLAGPTVGADNAPVAATSDGSWYELVAINRERAQTYEQLHNSPPIACPNDGEPLRPGKNGSRRCPFDGWTWPRDGEGIR